jgi:hypothetical protein
MEKVLPLDGSIRILVRVGKLCKTPRGAGSFGLGRAAAPRFLPIASALAAKLALQPIPIRTLGIREGFCRASLVAPQADGLS